MGFHLGSLIDGMSIGDVSIAVSGTSVSGLATIMSMWDKCLGWTDWWAPAGKDQSINLH